MKECSACKKLKSYDLFNRDSKTSDGHAEKCKDCRKPILRAWAKRYRKKHSQQTLAWDKRNKEKRLAYGKIRRALKAGIIEKPKTCKRCSETHIHAHHPDYSKPLEVLWLCPMHHKAEHSPTHTN